MGVYYLVLVVHFVFVVVFLGFLFNCGDLVSCRWTMRGCVPLESALLTWN